MVAKQTTQLTPGGDLTNDSRSFTQSMSGKILQVKSHIVSFTFVSLAVVPADMAEINLSLIRGFGVIDWRFMSMTPSEQSRRLIPYFSEQSIAGVSLSSRT